MASIRNQLETKGFCAIPSILTPEECNAAYEMFHDWKNTIPDHDYIHNSIDPHGIYKYHRAGHTKHAWFIRTRPAVQNVFKQIWGSDELVVSFDGCCYIPKKLGKKDKNWTHSDQAPTSHGLQCIQGFVSLTDNTERTFVVYEGSHKIHQQFFKDRNIQNNKNWNRVSDTDAEQMKHLKRTLSISAGSLVLWDSRAFHQNQYGRPFSEERIVQYICYLPKNHIKNTSKTHEKRVKYFEEQRTTSHWPAPVRVNGLQPQTYGNDRNRIDYTAIKKTNLRECAFYGDILKLL
jgi:hypothetical protein